MRYFLALAVLLLTSTSALSQGQSTGQLCRDRPIVIEYLSEKYSERPIIVMVDSGGRLVEVVVNIQTGSWSLVVTTPRTNIGCVVAFGSGIQFLQYQELRREFPPSRREIQ